MNTENLIAYSRSLIESAMATHDKLLRLAEIHRRIQEWLINNGVAPTSTAIRPHPARGFDLTYTFTNDLAVPFAYIEETFWDYVDDQIAVGDEIRHARQPGVMTPLLSALVRDESWDVIVAVHPDVLIDECPGREFWKSAYRAERAGRSDVNFERLQSLRNSPDGREPPNGISLPVAGIPAKSPTCHRPTH